MLSQVKNVYKLYSNVIVNNIGPNVIQIQPYSIKKHQGERDRIMHEKQDNVDLENVKKSVKDTYDPTPFRKEYPDLYNNNKDGESTQVDSTLSSKNQSKFSLTGPFGIFEEKILQEEEDDDEEGQDHSKLAEKLLRDKLISIEIKDRMIYGPESKADYDIDLFDSDGNIRGDLLLSEREKARILGHQEDLPKNRIFTISQVREDTKLAEDEEDDDDEGLYLDDEDQINEEEEEQEMGYDEDDEEGGMISEYQRSKAEAEGEMKKETLPEDFDEYEADDMEEAYLMGEEEYDNEVDLYPGLPIIRPKKKPFQEFTKYGLYNPNNIFAEGLIDLFRDPEQYIKRYTERYNIEFKDYIRSLVKDLSREEYYSTITELAEQMKLIATRTEPFTKEELELASPTTNKLVDWDSIVLTEEDKKLEEKTLSSVEKCIAHLSGDVKIMRVLEKRSAETQKDLNMSTRNLFFYRNIKKALDHFYKKLAEKGYLYNSLQKSNRLAIEIEKFINNQEAQKAMKFNEKKPLSNYIPQLIDKSFIDKLKTELKEKGDFSPIPEKDQLLALQDLKKILKSQKPRDTKLELNPFEKFVDPSPILAFFNSLGTPAMARRRLSKMIRFLLKINRTPTAASLLTSEEKDILARRWPNSFMSQEELYDESTDIEYHTNHVRDTNDLGETIDGLKDFENLERKTDPSTLAYHYISQEPEVSRTMEDEEEDEPLDLDYFYEDDGLTPKNGQEYLAEDPRYDDDDASQNDEDEDDEDLEDNINSSNNEKNLDNIFKEPKGKKDIHYQGIYAGDLTMEIFKNQANGEDHSDVPIGSKYRELERIASKYIILGKPLDIVEQKPFFKAKERFFIKRLKKKGATKEEIEEAVARHRETQIFRYSPNPKNRPIGKFNDQVWADIMERMDDMDQEKKEQQEEDMNDYLEYITEEQAEFLGKFEHIYPDLFNENENLLFNENAMRLKEVLGENTSFEADEIYREAKEVFLDHAETYFEDIEDDLDEEPIKRVSRFTQAQEEADQAKEDQKNKLLGLENEEKENVEHLDEDEYDRELGEEGEDEEEFDSLIGDDNARTTDMFNSFVILDIARHTKVTKAGRIQSFSALTFGANGRGTGAVGYGKADTASAALRRSVSDGVKNAFTLDLLNGTTLPSGLDIKYRSTKIRFYKTHRPDEMNTRSRKQQLVLPMLGIYGTGFRTYGRRGWRNILETISRKLPNFTNPQEVARLLGKKYVNASNLYKNKPKPGEMQPLSELIQDKLENQVHRDHYDVDVLSQFLYDLDKKPRKKSRDTESIDIQELRAVYEKYYGNEDILNRQRFNVDLANTQSESSTKRRIDPMFTGVTKRKFERSKSKSN